MTDARKNFATWSISLDTTCPKCEHDFDILRNNDWWCETSIEPIEHGTERTRGVEVICPECEHEFTVDLDY
jgi:hypothetical protein